MKKRNRIITQQQIDSYIENLREQERAESTAKQYENHLRSFVLWLDGRVLTKQELIRWKRKLTENYSTATVNVMLAAVNGFLHFAGWNDMRVKFLKVQKVLFRDEAKELNFTEYERLVQTADQQGNSRLSLLLQTICATGIRVSELKFITAEAVERGKTEVSNKGKRRMILLSEKLRRILKRYIRQQKILSGPVFVTRTGKPLDRSNIWRYMKALCQKAGVDPAKVFPHNLRHLFARRFYAQEKDTCRLADILGHTNINTTRIYTMESGHTHSMQINRLNLVITT